MRSGRRGSRESTPLRLGWRRERQQGGDAHHAADQACWRTHRNALPHGRLQPHTRRRDLSIDLLEGFTICDISAAPNQRPA